MPRAWTSTPVAVRTAGENAALNGVADKLTVLVGDLSDKASGRYDIITATSWQTPSSALPPACPALMAKSHLFAIPTTQVRVIINVAGGVVIIHKTP